MGEKGRQTRTRFIDALIDLLQTKGVSDIRPADLTNAVGSVPSTFYNYFSSIEEVVIEACRANPQATPELLQLMHRDWLGKDASPRITAFVTEYLRFWDRHFALLLARNTAADAGVPGFLTLRQEQALPILDALSAKIGAARHPKRTATMVHPWAAAAVILAALERLAAADRHPFPGRRYKTASARAHLIKAAVIMIMAFLDESKT